MYALLFVVLSGLVQHERVRLQRVYCALVLFVDGRRQALRSLLHGRSRCATTAAAKAAVFGVSLLHRCEHRHDITRRSQECCEGGMQLDQEFRLGRHQCGGRLPRFVEAVKT